MLKKKFDDNSLNCPRCNVVMRKIHKDTVTIDVCDKCRGMWLDDGEIHKLLEVRK